MSLQKWIFKVDFQSVPGSSSVLFFPRSFNVVSLGMAGHWDGRRDLIEEGQKKAAEFASPDDFSSGLL